MPKSEDKLAQSIRRPWTPSEIEDEKHEIARYYGESPVDLGSASTSAERYAVTIAVMSNSDRSTIKTNERSSQGFTNLASPFQAGRKPLPSIVLPGPSYGFQQSYSELESVAVLPSQKRALASASASALASPVSPVTPSNPFVKFDGPSSPRPRDFVGAPGLATSPSQAIPTQIESRPVTTTRAEVGNPSVHLPAAAFSIEETEGILSVSGTALRTIDILLINPTVSIATTRRCVQCVAPTLPPGVTVHGFTASRPAPTAIESHLDAVMSTAACLSAILPIASKYDAFLVISFGSHLLVEALREELFQPVLGIMEAAVHASQMLGNKLGVLTTDKRAALMTDSTLRKHYGSNPHVVAAESSRMTTNELETAPHDEVVDRLVRSAKKLQHRGADCVCLGSAEMTSCFQEELEDALGTHDGKSNVIDGVRIGVQFLIGLVYESLGTAKGGKYKLPNVAATGK